MSTVASCWITDEPGGRASYGLEFANASVASVIGSIIQRSSQIGKSHQIRNDSRRESLPRLLAYQTPSA